MDVNQDLALLSAIRLADIGCNIAVMSKTFTVSVRLRRVTTETAYVSVPLMPDLLEPKFDQSGKIDTEKLMQMAVDLGRQPSTIWTLEGEAVITSHPIQTSPD